MKLGTGLPAINATARNGGCCTGNKGKHTGEELTLSCPGRSKRLSRGGGQRNSGGKAIDRKKCREVQKDARPNWRGSNEQGEQGDLGRGVNKAGSDIATWQRGDRGKRDIRIIRNLNERAQSRWGGKRGLA